MLWSTISYRDLLMVVIGRGVAPQVARQLVVSLTRAATLCVARPYRGSGATCLVLAPHADDETLGCGALIARKRAAGVRVVVAIVTDGALSDRLGRPPSVVARVRRQEAARACAALGVRTSDLLFLGVPDGSLADDVGALVDRLDALGEVVRPDEVLVCSALDGHPDHVALAEACGRSTLATGGLHEYLVWGWSTWPAPMVRAFGEAPDRSAGAVRLLRLLRAVRRSDAGGFLHQKAAAVRCYDSQAGDGSPGRGVPPVSIQRHLRRHEVLLERSLPC